MQGVDRTRRVGQLIRRELASIIARELPGSALGILSLTAVSLHFPQKSQKQGSRNT
jgi:ribosome-binding factor A